MEERRRNQLALSAFQQARPFPYVPGHLRHASTQEEVSPAVKCAENIILLERLDQLPKPPTTHAEPRLSQNRYDDVRRSLSMDQENELATNLAFLAGISDNPNYIMAVCVEELPNVGGCHVLIAINKRLPTDGDAILNKVQRGFRQIFGRLKKVSAGTRAATEEAVFNDIVALCSEKILSRLRSKKAKTYSSRPKPRFFGLVLQEFLESPWQYRVNTRTRQMTMAHLTKYRRRLEDLLASLNHFEAADVVSHEDLSRLVGHIALATKAVPLERLLEGLTNQDMSPTSRDRLLDCLSKMTRYRECARFLCWKAEKLPMLRNVIVQKVQYAAQAEGISLPSLTTVGFEQSLRRFQYRGEPVQISTLPDWLARASMSFPHAFSKNVNQILREAKVHAEVQLLAHCENVSHGVLPPRILASSKDACYLCHSLIRLHGKYAVPKSHGRLYKGWCLPAAYQEGWLQRKFNSFLERQISVTLQSLMALTTRPPRIFSNESTIFPITLSESAWTDPSSSRREAVALAQNFEGNATGSRAVRYPHAREMGFYSVDDDVSTPRDIPVDTSVDDSGGESNHDVGDGGVDQATDNDAGSDGIHLPLDGSLAGNVVEAMLEPGQTITYEPGPGSKFYFRTKRMKVLIDDTSAGFSLTWLSEPVAEAVLRADTDAVLDVESVSSGVDVTLTKDTEGHTYFAVGGEIVKIRALDRPEDHSS